MSEIYEISERVNKLSREILDVCFYVHTKLGPGLLESVYEDAVYELLIRKNITVVRQKILPVQIDDIVIASGLKLDLLVEDSIIVELKATEKMIPLYEAQLHTYLKLSGKSLGLLINFNVPSLKQGIKRVVMTRKEYKNFA